MPEWISMPSRSRQSDGFILRGRVVNSKALGLFNRVCHPWMNRQPWNSWQPSQTEILMMKGQIRAVSGTIEQQLAPSVLHVSEFSGKSSLLFWPVRSELRIQLKTALGGTTTLKYIYDFGDHWEHRIKVEKKLPGDPELSHHALCLGGANAAPPEDVGGASGYADFVFAIVDPNHPERQQMREWYGDSFDPTHFDDIALNLAYQDLKI